MRFIFLLLLSINTQAGLFDFVSIHQANKAYENKDYQLAAEKFDNINNDAARLNQANSLYKQGLYKQALKKYQSVKREDLAFDRLYNSGNAYAKSGKINEAIDSYEKALKLQKDKDALFNLELLKKQKRRKISDTKQKNKKHRKQKNKKKKKSKSKQQQKEKLNKIKQQRWEKALNKKLRTLMIPLTKPQNDNEQNPW
ncbi:MAG: tetratricopeptide repeat protein [Candidatus Ruthia sp.]|nr:tetratricopeptide repeat protein [Candidatus Ruthturnera sp.]MBT4122717.1 tetratricopeptide repeat protein [Candidatus Ruthturnera sp.]MBT6922355.1 tetratricopeptide repeat protein [Candidatus Ruthturnera sp.]